MKPLVIRHFTRMLGPPPGRSLKEVHRLAIRDVTFDCENGDQVNIQYSAWQPSDEELALLAQGGKIYVGVHGTVFPPISVCIGTKLLEADPD